MSPKKLEAQRRYKAKNKEMIRAKARAYYAANKERHAASARRWRAANRDRLRAAAKMRLATDEAYRNHRRATARANRKANPRDYCKKYGITRVDRDARIEQQGGRCPGCTRAFLELATRKRINVDHDHRTGRVRGILCHGCNVALGFASDSPETLRRLAAYLEAAA
jgi:hypothetical protein